MKSIIKPQLEASKLQWKIMKTAWNLPKLFSLRKYSLHLDLAIRFNDYFAEHVLMATCFEYFNGKKFPGKNFSEVKNSQKLKDSFSRILHFNKFCRTNISELAVLNIFVGLIFVILTFFVNMEP